MSHKGIVFFVLLFLTLSNVKNSDAQLVRSPTIFRDCSDCPEMTVVPAGSFSMGTSSADSIRDIQSAAIAVEDHLVRGMLEGDVELARKSVDYEHPQHTVNIPTKFGLSTYPVTVVEFEKFVDETGYSTASCILMERSRQSLISGPGWKNPGFDQSQIDPVVCINWNDANAYIAWLNKKASKRSDNKPDGVYRLPSESEWEYAARAGTTTARWWGDDIGINNAQCQGCASSYNIGTVAANAFRPNSFGLYDMLGNVWQWTEDCWHDTYQGAPQDGRPWESSYCSRRVTRGGGWNNFPWSVRSTTRAGLYEGLASNARGFRVAKTLR